MQRIILTAEETLQCVVDDEAKREREYLLMMLQGLNAQAKGLRDQYGAVCKQAAAIRKRLGIPEENRAS